MPRLLVQADDNGISQATALGVLEAIRYGIVRNTGLFTNMPASRVAAESLREANGVSVGIDLNFVTGRPISSPPLVPTLVDDHGAFRSSGHVRSRHTSIGHRGHITVFDDEPFPYEEALIEGRAQLDRFQGLMGRPPSYIHHHALVTPDSNQVVLELAAEIGVPVPMELAGGSSVRALPNPWYRSPFPLDAQATADPLTPTLEALEGLGQYETGLLITHPGFVDAALLELSSFSVVRARDLQMLCSDTLRRRIDDLGIELISYDEINADRVEPTTASSLPA